MRSYNETISVSLNTLLANQAPITQRDDWIAYLQVRPKLINEPLRRPGRIEVLGWDVEYVSGPALASAIEYLVLYGINNFYTEKEKPVILDCGSNIGISVLNYKRQFPGAKIIAFEPDPEFVPILHQNLQQNGAADVSVVESAVWVEDGEMSWYSEGVDGSKLVTSPQTDGQTLTVHTVDLAPYLANGVDLIKLDIEGAEYKVVTTLGDKLKQVRNMIIECHIYCGDMTPLASLLATLTAVGFNTAINSLSAWRDLVRQPEVPPHHFSQYLLVAAWRDSIPSNLPYAKIPASGGLFQQEVDLVRREIFLTEREAEFKAQLHLTQTELYATQAQLAQYESSKLIQLARKLIG